MSVTRRNLGDTNFAIRKETVEAVGDETEFERFTGLDVTRQETLWSVDLVDEHLEYAPLHPALRRRPGHERATRDL